ncbi:N-6 DNA methylase [Candidatus Uhrbacteria bacterium]|nr:N-6 DNA methylase [Candidatus Uhrbacteria bacterium]
MAKDSNNKTVETFEKQLFKAADKLRKNIDAAEYKHVVLGLVFLKYISDSFEELYNKLKEGKGEYEGADPEDQDEYRAQNVFWVPQNARWSYLHSRAKLPTIGTDLDEAMELIEKENPTLKGILAKVYAKPNLDKAALGGLIDLISNTALGSEAAKSKDLLGRVYEYFLGEFANAEGKKGGQFYTPKAIVRLLVEMIEPYKGRVYDPCCGSGGMFVMSEKFVLEHSGRLDDVSIYGQESNQTTYRLSRMNMAIRGIDGSQIKWNSEGSFLKDAHPDLKADYIIANPPFNQSDWGQEILRNDPRWQFGLPPASNANFGWMQHMIYHLAPHGVMGLVLANGSLSSNSSGEGEIRQRMIEADLVDCIVSLPTQLFYNTGISACLWFISRKRSGNGDRKRTGEILFIDASEMGHMIDSTHREFTDADVAKVSSIYHEWRKDGGSYSDEKGLCKSGSIKDIEKHHFVLTPSRYVGVADDQNSKIPFEFQIENLNKFGKEQARIESILNQEIIESIKYFCPNYDWANTNFLSTEILEQITQMLFKEWFLEFNFLDDNGKPYKKSGGEMIENDFGLIPKGWSIGKVGEIIDIFDSQRIPLSSRERTKRKGEYRYYGATSIMDYVDDYLFEGIYLLLGEDGSVIDDKGYPILQYVWGKFWVNNHAHVLQGKNGYSTEMLYLLFKNTRVAGIVNGAVQLKINQGNLLGLEIVIPERKILDTFCEKISPIFKKIRFMHDQLKNLASINKNEEPQYVEGQSKTNIS